MDKTDRLILAELSANARITLKELAKVCKMSSVAVHQRIKKLEEQGVIMNYRVQIDYRALGYQTTTYVGIFLSRAGLYRDVLEQLEKVPEILECSFTTGNYSMLVKIICKDNQHLMELLSEKVQSIDGVARTETFVVLENAINRDLMLREKI